MAERTRSQLKNLWVNGYTPTQSNFSDLFDSFFNLEDDTMSGGTGGGIIKFPRK